MGVWSSDNLPTRENVLKKFSELEIFNYYFNTSLKEGDFFCNPLRNDRNPTCNFYRGGDGRLRMIDRAGYFHGDCFDLVGGLYNLNYPEAIKRIWRDLSGGQRPVRYDKTHFDKQKTRRYKKILVKRLPWDEHKLAYWRKFGVSLQTLEKYEVFPLHKVWLEATYVQNVAAVWSDKDPMYGYHFGDGDWKIYFPFRKSLRFMGNSGKIQGLNQLEDSDYLVITKSLKDVMVLHEFGIPAVAPQSEAQVLPELDDMLRYYETVFVLFDNDRPGKVGAVKYRHEGCIPLMIPNSKDISDHYRDYGFEQTKILIDETKNIFGFGC